MEKKPNTSTNENLKALEEIIRRVKNSIDRRETTNLKFEIAITSGLISKVSWNTDREISFDG